MCMCADKIAVCNVDTLCQWQGAQVRIAMANICFIFLCIIAFRKCSGYMLLCPNGLPIYEQGITEQGIEEVVSAHNYFRRLLVDRRVDGQPRAANMKMMKYDKALGREAAEVSMSCRQANKFARDPRWPWVGQNVHWNWSTIFQPTPQNWSAVVESWFREVKYYKYPEPASRKTGHYVQVVWANSEYVGCDYVMYKGFEGYASYIKMYTCNYGPGGNYIDQPPYKTNDVTW